MSIEESLFEAEEKMEKAVGVAKDDFATIRTGRANPAMFNKINVEYYGTYTPLNQLASFTTPEPRMIIVAPYDKGSMSAIEKAIRDSDLGVNPSNDGVIIRIVLPAAHRRAPPGVHQGRQAQGRGRANLHPQCPQARQGRARPPRQGRRVRRGRGQPRREGPRGRHQALCRPGR